jgi:tetratricopeptide (TPR) repeat protein
MSRATNILMGPHGAVKSRHAGGRGLKKSRRPAALAPRRRVPWGWAVVAGALVAKLVVVAQLHGHPLLRPVGVLDDAVYFRLAQRAAAGDWALGPDAYYVSPLYIYFLAAIFRLSGAVALHAQVAQAVLGAGGVALAWRCATRLFGARGGLMAAALMAATGVLTFNEALVLQSAIDPFLSALALERLSSAVARPSHLRFGATGVAFGLLGLNRPNALVALAVVAIVLFVALRSRSAAAHALLLCAGAAAALAPVAIRNRAVAGEWILVSSHGGMNFLIGNSATADGTYQAPPGVTPSIEGQRADTRRVAERAAGRPLTDSEVSDYYYAQGLRWIREHPRAAAGLFARKLALAFHRADLPLNYSYAYWSRDEPTLLRFLLVGPWLLVPLGVAGFFVPRALDRPSFLAWASFIPAYALALAVFFVATRYRQPLLVALCVTAGGALAWVAEAAAGRHRERLPRVAAAAALAAAVAFWPWPIDEGVANERTERIVHLVMEGRHGDARALFERTLPIHRDPALLHYRVGRAWLDAGRPEEAVPHFEKSLAAVPGQGEVHLVLGQALLRMDRAADAVPHLERARAAGAFADVAGLDLARALVAVGRRDEARKAIASTPLLADTDAPTAATLGAMTLALGDADVALRFLDDALRRAPDLASAHEDRGLALATLGRTEEAMAALEAAARLAPADPTVPYNLALLHARAGRFAEARRLAERALALDPSNPHPRELIGKLNGR